MGILACILYLMGLAEISMTWLMGFSLIFIATITIAYITPIFTQHEINSQGITIRQGAIFNTLFTFQQIESVEVHNSRTGILGLRRSRIVLASGNNGLVMIKLNHRKRFGMLLLRKADEIIIDLEKPEEFVKLANENLKV